MKTVFSVSPVIMKARMSALCKNYYLKKNTKQGKKPVNSLNEQPLFNYT